MNFKQFEKDLTDMLKKYDLDLKTFAYSFCKGKDFSKFGLDVNPTISITIDCLGKDD